MADYKEEYNIEENKIVKTLTLFGKDYIEEWEDVAGECTCTCSCDILSKIENNIDEIPVEIYPILEEIASDTITEFERMEYLMKLEKWERND